MGVGVSHTRVLLSGTYSSRKISTNFPNLLELSFLTVLALPKDSSKGVASRICHSHRENCGVSLGTPTCHRLSPWCRDPPCHPPTSCPMQTPMGAQIPGVHHGQVAQGSGTVQGPPAHACTKLHLPVPTVPLQLG